ncbi:MAG TPA: metal-dependent hydrolase [Vicinamibacterales bacterium]
MKYCHVPSPIGHALAGVAAGWLAMRVASGQSPVTSSQSPVPSHQSRSRTGWELVTGGWRLATGNWRLFAAAGMLPDIDLLFGAHSGPTHGVGAAVIAGALAWGVLRAGGGPRASGLGVRVGLAVAAAYASHTLLDWLGSDTSAPVGIMALWPFSDAYYESRAHVFMAISRRYWLPEFWTWNVVALARELVILVPLVALAAKISSPAAAVSSQE